MAGSSNTTTDHKIIQKWVEARDGKPVTVRGTGDSEEAGILRIDFPGGAGSDRLEEISWEEWFEKFDEKKLAFLYQEETRDGEQSRFFKLISQETAEDKNDHKSNGKNGHKAEARHEAKGKDDHKAKDEAKSKEKAKSK